MRTTRCSPTARQVDAVKDLTDGEGADVVLDFVAEEGAENEGFAMTRPGRAPTSSSGTAAR